MTIAFARAMTTLLILSLAFQAQAHTNPPSSLDNVVSIKSRLRERKKTVEHSLICADLLVANIGQDSDAMVKLNVIDRLVGLESSFRHRLRKVLKTHVQDPTLQDFLDLYVRNASKLAAVMKAISHIPTDSRAHADNYLRALMLYDLGILVAAATTLPSDQGLNHIPQTLDGLIESQKLIAVLAEILESYEKSLPGSELVSIISDELAAMLFQSSQSPLHFDEKIFANPDIAMDVRDFYQSNFDYRMSPVLECYGLGTAKYGAFCDGYKPVREIFSLVKNQITNTRARNGTSCTYHPDGDLCDLAGQAVKIGALGYMTEAIFLRAYSHNEDGSGGKGDFEKLRPFIDWLNKQHRKVAYHLKTNRELSKEKVALDFQASSRVYREMMPELMRSYAKVRLLQGPSEVDSRGDFVSMETREKIEIDPGTADRTVQPLFKKLNAIVQRP